MTTGPPAAWYADPGGSGGLRYWDGAVWTEHVTGPAPHAYGAAASMYPGMPYQPMGGGPATVAKGRRLWPLFAVIGVLFLAAVIAGIVLAVPRVVRASGRVTDVAAQHTAHVALDAGAQVYALDGSYLSATPERLEELERSITFTNGASTDFTTVSVQAGETQFTVAVASFTGRCYVAIIGDEVGGPRTTGRLGDDVPCWASLAADHPLLPVDGF